MSSDLRNAVILMVDNTIALRLLTNFDPFEETYVGI